VEGADRIPATGGALLTANHVSFADAVLISSLTERNIRFLIWRPIYEKPLLKRFFDAMGAIPVGGGTAGENARALDAAHDALAEGALVAVFPEGQITRDGRIDEFKRGFERIVGDTGLPVIPIHIEGLYGHPLSYKGGGLFRSWERTWGPPVTITVGAPTDSRISAEQLREAVVQLAGECSVA
jgi:1-acyl-sn-glycerol-3-phosphate acyltransferase